MELGDYRFATLRDQYPRDDYMQGVLGPMDHSAAVQDLVENNPVLGLLASIPGIPAYTGLKYVSKSPAGKYMPDWLYNIAGNARSPASLDEIFAGYEGAVKGLLK